MSQKTGKRTRKHTEDSPQAAETNEETEEKPETVSIKDETAKTAKDTEKCENGTETRVQEDKPQTKEISSSPLCISPSTESEEVSQSADTSLHCQDIVETANSEQNEGDKSEQECSEIEMEPLVLETEQTNGVQILVENTDGLNENIEKVAEENKEECKGSTVVQENVNEEQVANEEEVVNGEHHSDSEETIPKEDEEVTEKINELENGETEHAAAGKSLYSLEDISKTQSSSQNSDILAEISTQAVAGSDTTRFEENFEYSKFLTASKDQSFGKSLRYLSSRRSIRTVNYFPVDGNTYNLNQANVRKRKNCEEEFQSTKRAKGDSPGLMSYFGYPFKKSDVQSSTPKLTGYKVSSFDNNVSKISLNSTNEKATNKWCSVM